MSDPTKNGELDQLIEKYRGGEVTRRHFVKVAGGLGKRCSEFGCRFLGPGPTQRD